MPQRRATIALVAGFLAIAGAPQAQPANDDCADARVITSLPFVDSVDMSAATNEPGDPPLQCYGDWEVPPRSVWWTYTAPSDVQLVLTIKESSTVTALLAVHRGTCGALSEPVCYDGSNGPPVLPVGVSAGETLLIQAADSSGIELRIANPQAGTPFMLGAEFQVNTYTEYDQGGYIKRGVGTCGDGAGNFVVVWQSERGQDGSRTGIFAQRYDSAGVLAGGEFQVNEYTTDYQQEPAVACENDGDFVVVWGGSGPGTGGFGVHGRRFNADGTPKGGDFLIGDGAHDPVGLAGDTAGDFLVVWDGYVAGSTIQGRVFDDTGSALGPPFTVSPPEGTDPKRFPSVATDPAGRFTVVWQAGYGHDVFARRIDEMGVPLGDEFQVNTHTAFDYTHPAVAHGPGGDFAVVWIGDDEDVFARHFGAGGAPTAGEFVVGLQDGGFTYLPAVASVGADDFVVAWTEGVDSSTDVYGQRFTGGGGFVGGRFKVNTTDEGGNMYESIAPSAAGEFVVAWSSRGIDATAQSFSDYGVGAQRFRVPAPVPGCTLRRRTDCHEPTIAGKGRLTIRNKTADAGDSLTWKWAKGEATPLADFGFPETTDGFALCLYNQPFELEPLSAAGVAPGGTCGDAPCWQPRGTTGWRYVDADGNDAGIQKIVLKAGDDGRAKVTVKGKGIKLPVPPLPPFLPLTIQLQGRHACWTATFEASGILKNESTVFAAKPSAGTPGSPSGAFVP